MYAVISGDLVKSQKIPKEQYDAMLYQLDQSCRFISNLFSIKFTIYRGDAVQIQLDEPQLVCRIAVLLYLQLKASNYTIRQSLAIGQIDNARADIKTATGSAFTLSGQGLDNIGQQQLCLQIAHCPLEESFALNIALIDVLLDKMSAKQANALFYYLTAEKNNHAALAKELHSSRENVTKLLNLAHYQLIERFLDTSQTAITAHIKGTNNEC